MGAGILRRRLLQVAGFALPLVVPAHAQVAAEGGKSNADAPFADHHLALQLSDRDEGKQALVLSVANNMLTVYGPDKIALEVVAFGPGIDLLRGDSPHRKAVDSLVSQGVTFDVCMNTVETIERKTGERPYINEKAVPVQAGVAHILSLVENGYTLVRP